VIAATQSSLCWTIRPEDVLVADLVDDATAVRRLEADRLAIAEGV